MPARILNEFTYCPRLAYLEWVQQEWADNVETLEGRHAHRRVDRKEGYRAKVHQRSIHLTSTELGLTAVLDLIESRGGKVRPVDYKRGKKPAVPGGAWEPERIQLCAQGLLLREHGYQVSEGVLYFVASNQRVRIRFTPALKERTRSLLTEARESLTRGTIPPPLEDSVKCRRCSLVGICLPEEVRFLTSGDPIRPLAVGDPATFPLIVQEPGVRVRKRGERFEVHREGRIQASARIVETSQVVAMGGAGVTMPALHECCRRGIPVVHMSGTGWFYGLTRGFPHKNVELRAAQFEAASDARRCLPLARALVVAKIRNSRVLLRRNGQASRADLQLLASLARRAGEARDTEVLLGIEGSAARTYFGGFSSMLKGEAAACGELDVEGRTRRPPKDPVNALLSFAYGLLTKDWTVTLHTVGFDPMMGFYHQPRYGKPALALDLMEPFRPVLADSVVVGVLNNGEITVSDFLDRPGGVLIKPEARKRFLRAYERRLSQQVRHPVFGYRATYRRIFELQARLLARYLLGEIPDYPAFEIR